MRSLLGYHRVAESSILILTVTQSQAAMIRKGVPPSIQVSTVLESIGQFLVPSLLLPTLILLFLFHLLSLSPSLIHLFVFHHLSLSLSHFPISLHLLSLPLTLLFLFHLLYLSLSYFSSISSLSHSHSPISLPSPLSTSHSPISLPSPLSTPFILMFLSHLLSA